jgi:hypothetical protein
VPPSGFASVVVEGCSAACSCASALADVGSGPLVVAGEGLPTFTSPDEVTYHPGQSSSEHNHNHLPDAAKEGTSRVSDSTTSFESPQLTHRLKNKIIIINGLSWWQLPNR